jgi:hypothetical protein
VVTAVRKLDQFLAVLSEAFYLRQGKRTAAEGESSNAGEFHCEKLLGD